MTALLHGVAMSAGALEVRHNALTTSKLLALTRAIGWLGRDSTSAVVPGCSDRVSRPANTYCSDCRSSTVSEQAG